MRLTNEISVATEPERLFEVLMDVERVAPCLPGATLEGRDGDSYRGSVRVKVGPMVTAYRGRVRFLEIDKDARRVVLDARGADPHGGGNAEAKVIAQVRPDGHGSVLALETDLLISGKVAQFGRGVLGDISQQLMQQFAQNLSAQLHSGSPRTPPRVSPSAPMGEAGEAAEIDAWTMLAVPMLKRAAPFAAAFAAGMALGVALGVFLQRRR
ncbi:MAG TPA: SRPBCC family protein, partial [Myxococcaceae bacterium]|nr:SRPBCC family protein [Myxococcaceae bacterium]